MRLSSFILSFLFLGTVFAHEKHISTLTVTDAKTPNAVCVTVNVHLPDYLACSKVGKDGFEQWANSQMKLSLGGEPAQLKMDSLIWGHDIRAVFTAPAGNISTLNVYCNMFSACFPNQKTIVAAQLGGQNFGRVLSPQKDTCVFQIRK